VLKGPAHSETVGAYARAQGLAEGRADPGEHFCVIWSVFSGHHFAARFPQAEAAARKGLARAEREGDPRHLCQAHRMLAYLEFFLGRLPQALHHVAEVRRHYRPDQHRGLAPVYGADCRVGTEGFEGVALALLGREAEALDTAAGAIRAAKQLGHPASVGWALAAAAYVHHYRRDREGAQRVAVEGFAYCRDHGIGAWGLHCKVFIAWALATDQTSEEFVEQILADIVDAGTRTKLGLPMLRGLAAEGLILCGRAGDACEQAQTALDEIAATGQEVFRPTLLRLRGLCALALGDRDSAEARLRESVAAARALGTALLEAHARRDLAALTAAGEGAGPALVRALLLDGAGRPART
jgi:hypothetical protein